jgi:hypothetical protein
MRVEALPATLLPPALLPPALRRRSLHCFNELEKKLTKTSRFFFPMLKNFPR